MTPKSLPRTPIQKKMLKRMKVKDTANYTSTSLFLEVLRSDGVTQKQVLTELPAMLDTEGEAVFAEYEFKQYVRVATATTVAPISVKDIELAKKRVKVVEEETDEDDDDEDEDEEDDEDEPEEK